VVIDSWQDGFFSKMNNAILNHTKIKIWVAVTFLTVSSFIGFQVLAIDFTAEEKRDLSLGETIVRLSPDCGKNGVYGGSGWAVINAPPAQVWAAIQDWDSYPEMFINTLETTELSRKNGNSLIRMRLGHPLIKITYHVQMNPNREKWTIAFSLVRSHKRDIDEINGSWRLFPMKGGKTLLLYVLKVSVPMGIVNVLPEAFKKMAVRGVLGVPGGIKEWMEEKAGARYRNKK
jgi:ribosome-associated toxin RatA of RatAB toxin-antitoxin module